jgi:hypothetical protein
MMCFGVRTASEILRCAQDDNCISACTGTA